MTKGFGFSLTLVVAALALSGCGQTVGDCGLSGAGIGAAGGAVIGAMVGAPLVGAAIGAGAGAVAGAVTSPLVGRSRQADLGALSAFAFQ